MKQKIIQAMNETFEYHKWCVENKFDTFYDDNLARMKGMIEIAEIALGCKFKITRDGIVEVQGRDSNG